MYLTELFNISGEEPPLHKIGAAANSSQGAGPSDFDVDVDAIAATMQGKGKHFCIFLSCAKKSFFSATFL